MEATNEQLAEIQVTNDEDGSGGRNKSSNSYLCRQTSSRWTPTSDQIRILKELYYNNGVRSPSAEQIQKISAKLRHYGKIEGKNVFYWFQNHKARERQKKKLSSSSSSFSEFPLMQQQKCVWRSDESFLYNKCLPPNFSSEAPSSSGGMMADHAVNQFGKCVYGSMAVEKSVMGGQKMKNIMWAGNGNGMDPFQFQYQSSSYTFLEKKKCYYDDSETLDDDDEQEQDEEEEERGRLETLPLFPMHDEGLNGNLCNLKQESASNYNWCQQSDGSMGCSRASLDLTLNSYGSTCTMSPFSP